MIAHAAIRFCPGDDPDVEIETIDVIFMHICRLRDPSIRSGAIVREKGDDGERREQSYPEASESGEDSIVRGQGAERRAEMVS
jgi:hypothetical protein